MMKNLHLKVSLLVSVVIMLSACSQKTSPLDDTTPKEAMVFPVPPEQPRFQHLTSINSSAAIEKPRSKFAQFIMGQKDVGLIHKPYGITSTKGKIYVCDQGGHTLEILDLENKKFTFFNPGGRGQFRSPFNCAVDENNNLYVADLKRNQVVVSAPNGGYLNAIGDTGVYRPLDVFVHDKKVYVVDSKGKKIKVYSTEEGNKFLYEFLDKNLAEKNKLSLPVNIFVNDKYLYVSDQGDSKIKKYTLDGKFASSFGGMGKTIGSFARPKGIAVDRDLNVFVLDGAFSNLQIFNDNNQLLMYIDGSTSGMFHLPATIHIDYDNLEYFQKYVDPSFKLNYLIYITNQYGPNKVQVFGAIEEINKKSKPSQQNVEPINNEGESIKKE